MAEEMNGDFKQQFDDFVENARLPPTEAEEDAKTVPETQISSRDILMFAANLKSEADLYKKLTLSKGGPDAARWFSIAAWWVLEFCAARLEQMVTPTVSHSPKVTQNAIEQAFQNNVNMLQSMMDEMDKAITGMKSAEVEIEEDGE